VEEYGIGFRKNSNLTEKVNEATKELIADGTLAEIAQKYDLTLQLIANQQ
jgi:polar amino acid transport system substrate-binding protein